jgi:GTP:adenosylcobinamide-phosphate guanylyltransferase
LTGKWHALVLAASRGADDPMAKAFDVRHKAALPVGGVAMLARVVAALKASRSIETVTVCMESRDDLLAILNDKAAAVEFCPSAQSAPSSVLSAIGQKANYPLLVTTADHALLTPQIIDYFCTMAETNEADLSVGLAKAETILAAYPQSVRTFFRLGRDRVSGCNLFALTNERGKVLVEKWQELDRQRKQPWKLVAAFGPIALLRFAVGWISVNSAFRLISKRLGITARSVLMPFAEAAIDVDKPADFELAETILASRQIKT